MKFYGNGANGFALVTLQQSEADEYRDDLWLNERIFKLAVPQAAERETTLRIALKARGAEKMDAGQARTLQAPLLELLKSRNVRSVVAVGTIPFHLLTDRTGSEERYAGSVIETTHGFSVVPISPPWKVEHFLNKRYMAQLIKRAHNISKGQRKHAWQPLYVEPNEEMLEALRGIARRGGPVGVDIETAGIDILAVPITSMGVADAYAACASPWEAYDARRFGPVAGIESYGSVGRAIREAYLAILTGPQVKILHNGAYDILGLRKRDIQLGGEIEDTLLLHRVVYPERAHNLQITTVGELPVEPWKADFKSEVGDFVENDARVMRLYNAKDCACEPVVFESLRRKLDKIHNGPAIYAEMKELAAIAGRMQEVGVRNDQAEALKLKATLEAELAELRATWATFAPGIELGKAGGSPKITTFFIEKLNAPILYHTDKNKPSVPSAALLQYRGMGDPQLAKAAQTCFYYRKKAKLLTAFVEKMAPKTRIHATFKVWGTKGSRWSSSGPNLQQVSKAKEELAADGKTTIQITPSIRNLITADEGFELMEADYSQLELREVAYFADIEEILYWLDMDRKEPGKWDPHVLHARMMFGDPTINKKHMLRQLTKGLTYAMFYNYFQGTEAIFKALKPQMPTLTKKMLQEVAKRFYKARPQLPTWQQRTVAQAAQDGFVEAPMSGRRLIVDPADIESWANNILSFPIQSTGGDLANRAVKGVSAGLDWDSGEHLKLQVHDAFIVQCRPENRTRIARLLKETMEAPVQLAGKTVSFPVDVKYGPNWAHMTDLHL